MREQVVSKDGWLISSIQSRREQGWKLHISATVVSAVTVLERILPILAQLGVPFKVAADLSCLSDLNQGAGGLSQVGKFITIYPDDDLQAVQLAMELDRLTVGLAGPRIPSDQPLHPDSLVHYRYGGIGDLQITDSLGQILPAIRDPTGNLVADRRAPRFQPPPWAIH